MPEIEIVDRRPDRTIVKDYEPFKPLLDRILIRRIDEIASDDSFVVPEKYRQHSNWGEVVAVGDGVVLGQTFHPFNRPLDAGPNDSVRGNYIAPGDIVRYGEYTAEAYSVDDPSLWIVRIQDVRGIRRLVKTS